MVRVRYRLAATKTASAWHRFDSDGWVGFDAGNPCICETLSTYTETYRARAYAIAQLQTAAGARARELLRNLTTVVLRNYQPSSAALNRRAVATFLRALFDGRTADADRVQHRRSS